jgi:hypothetical protein
MIFERRFSELFIHAVAPEKMRTRCHNERAQLNRHLVPGLSRNYTVCPAAPRSPDLTAVRNRKLADRAFRPPEFPRAGPLCYVHALHYLQDHG